MCFFDSMGTVRNTPTGRATHTFTLLALALAAVKPNAPQQPQLAGRS